MWSPKDFTRALTSPNDVHHSLNLSNTKFITYIDTSFYHYFTEIYVNSFVLIFSKCQFRTFSPVSVRRWTGLPIHTKQNNHTTTKNIFLILYFETVLCHIVNMSNMLNTVHNSKKITVFLRINDEETKPFLNTHKAQLCVTKLFTLFQSPPPNKC